MKLNNLIGAEAVPLLSMKKLVEKSNKIFLGHILVNNGITRVIKIN
jgi:hypothetical protein